jgi:drug/metabolite transporter (DMT)-like permease
MGLEVPAMTIALGLAAAVLFATSDLCGLRATRQFGPAIATLLMLALGLAPAFVAMLAFGGIPTATAQREALGCAVLAGVAYYGGQASLMRGVQTGNLAVVGPIATLEGAVASGFAFGLGERIGPLVLAGIAAAVVGAVTTALEPGRRWGAEGAAWGIAAALLFGTASLLWAQTAALDTAGVVMLTRIGGLLLLAPLAFAAASPRRLPRSSLKLVGLATALELGAIAATTAALALGPISVASVCQSQYGTASAVLGLLLLREHLARTQLAGVGLTGFGVTLMALG